MAPLAIALLLPRLASAQDAASDAGHDAARDDAGSGDAAVPCGDVTWIGECDGDVERYCEQGQLRSIDCLATFGSNRTCGLWDCTSAGLDDRGRPLCTGYFCVARRGTACDLNARCDVAAVEGCLGGLCTDSAACNPAAFQRSCDGTVVTYCSYTVSNLDCAAGGSQPYTCGSTRSGTVACVGVAGAPCGSPGNVECAVGFHCDNNSCRADATPDATLPDIAPGRDQAVGDARQPDRWSAPDTGLRPDRSASPDGGPTDRGTDGPTVGDAGGSELAIADRVTVDRGAGDRALPDAAATDRSAIGADHQTPAPQLIDSSGGCGCRQAGPGALSAALFGLAAAWLHRRRAHRPAGASDGEVPRR